MHVMFDLETWGTRPGCALRSIGAIRFSPLGSSEACPDFYRNMSDESCAAIGLIFDPETVAWWSNRSAEARAHLQHDPRPIITVVDEFHKWFRQVGGKYLWCHGANFDEPLWAVVAQRLSRPVPWRYWDVRCTRTCYALMDFDPRSISRDFGVHHNALDDAKYQVRCVQAALSKSTKENIAV